MERLTKRNTPSQSNNLAEERALTAPIVIWRFCAYKTKKDYESGEHYFMRPYRNESF